MEKLLALAIVAVLAITVAAGVGIANMSQNGNTLAAPEPKAKNQIIAKPSQEADKNNQAPIPDQIPVQLPKMEPKVDAPGDMKPQPRAQAPAKATPRDLLGQTVSLEEAKNRANFTVLVPAVLPQDNILQSVRLGSWYSSDVVSLFYLGGLTIIQEKVAPNVNASLIAENAIRENQLNPNLIKPRLQRFAYAGAYGYGYDQWVIVQDGERTTSPGAISFIWNDAHYIIISYKSYNELAKIALSMLQ